MRWAPTVEFSQQFGETSTNPLIYWACSPADVVTAGHLLPASRRTRRSPQDAPGAQRGKMPGRDAGIYSRTVSLNWPYSHPHNDPRCGYFYYLYFTGEEMEVRDHRGRCWEWGQQGLCLGPNQVAPRWHLTLCPSGARKCAFKGLVILPKVQEIQIGLVPQHSSLWGAAVKGQLMLAAIDNEPGVD